MPGTTTIPEVRLANGADADAWNGYLAAQDAATFFHQFEWRRVFESVLGHKTHYLIAEHDGTVAGVLPLVEMKSFLFGHSLSSLPFATYGGPVSAEPGITKRLEASAIELARGLGVGTLEFRYRKPSGVDRPVKTLYETFSKPIEADPEANMKAIRSKQRNIIRKGIKNGLVSRECDIDTFYRVYAESVRNLGTPVFPRSLFLGLLEQFPAQVECLAAYHGERPVSAAMNFYFRSEVCPYYWGGVFEARNLNANDFLCWEIMNRASERGCTTFNFGRSKKETGAYRWKTNLGFEPEQLYYEYELVQDRVMPDINPSNPKYRVFIETWKRMPLPLARLFGPWLSRSLG